MHFIVCSDVRPGISDLDLSKVPHHLSHSLSTLIHWYCALMSNFPVFVCPSFLRSGILLWWWRCVGSGFSSSVSLISLSFFLCQAFCARRYSELRSLCSVLLIINLAPCPHFFIVFCSWRSVFLLSVASLLFVLFCTSIIMLLQFLFVVVFFSMLHPTFWLLQFFALSRSSVQCFFSLDFFCFNIPPVLFYY